VSNHPKIDNSKIALLGSSKGGELVLNLASRYNDIDAVVALVPSHVTFPAQTIPANTSAWTFNDKEIAYLKIPDRAFLGLLQGDSQRAWEIYLEKERSSSLSVIEVEKINGSILVLSAKEDELWPSNYMAEEIVRRLQQNQFKYYYQHFAFEGKHHDTKKHFEIVFKFLDEHFKLDR
jgi:uncharacterized protein